MSSRPLSTQPDLETDTARRVIVSLGANLCVANRSPAETLMQAYRQLESRLGIPLTRSSLWETEPEDCPPGTPPFINAVVIGWLPVSVSPAEVLIALHAVEAAFGRVRGGTVNAPRTLDLDLLCVGTVIMQESGLQLPHPRAHLRSFVLRPLAELLPDVVLPGQIQSVSVLVEQLPPSGDKKIAEAT